MALGTCCYGGSSDGGWRETLERKGESRKGSSLGCLETTLSSLQVTPFQEQASSSDEFQLVREPVGSSCTLCLNVKSAKPSSFKAFAGMWLQRRAKKMSNEVNILRDE